VVLVWSGLIKMNSPLTLLMLEESIYFFNRQKWISDELAKELSKKLNE